MFIGDRAAADYAAMIEREGKDISLTDPESNSYTIKALLRRTDMETDPQTGVKFYNPSSAATVSILTLGEKPDIGWAVSFTDKIGDTLNSKVADIRIDRTLASATMILEEAV